MMRWPWRRREGPPPFPARDFLTQIHSLPIGWSIMLPVRRADGVRALVAERIGRHSWAFWPADFEGANQ
jgi:hypothetical protein